MIAGVAEKSKCLSYATFCRNGRSCDAMIALIRVSFDLLSAHGAGDVPERLFGRVGRLNNRKQKSRQLVRLKRNDNTHAVHPCNGLSPSQNVRDTMEYHSYGVRSTLRPPSQKTAIVWAAGGTCREPDLPPHLA